MTEDAVQAGVRAQCQLLLEIASTTNSRMEEMFQAACLDGLLDHYRRAYPELDWPEANA